MKQFPILKRRALLNAAAFIFLLFYSEGLAKASGSPVEHRLEITLLPDEQKLIGRDLIRIQPGEIGELSCHLSHRARVQALAVNGSARPFRFASSDLIVPLDASERGRRVEIDIRYEAIFNDPIPANPLNTDNPGFGVTASISGKGVFLLAGAGWYPEIRNVGATYTLHVQAPAGMLAVTAGRGQGHQTSGGITTSDWLIEHPVQGLSLSAAVYEVQEQHAGDVLISLYLFPEDRDLAPAYLQAAADYIRFYSDLFGPYPFPKFAVVENFFPTGYGFPSYTLIGGSVLRLPFIIETSLGHEIAHSWWGNGVLVDDHAGNWSEGLTTYVSDYFSLERKSGQEARDYRLQADLSYSTLVPPDRDFALSQFTERTDPLSKAVGYDKGAMVFHMLRRTVGDGPFWSALREVYRERLFRETSWKDLQTIFEEKSNRSLAGFFDQWVQRKGAPKMWLEDVRAVHEQGRWRVEAALVQESPGFEFPVSASLDCGATGVTQETMMNARATSIGIACPTPPKRLIIDPDFDLLRRMDPSEIPPSVNQLKTSHSVLLVLGGETGGSLNGAAAMLALSLGLKDYRILAEKDLATVMFESHSVILVGFPKDRKLLPKMPEGVRLEKDHFTIQGRDYRDPSDSFFGVFSHPSASGRVLSVFYPLSVREAETVARKVPHYGKYSYISFHNGVNREKGLLIPEHSPVVYDWNER